MKQDANPLGGVTEPSADSSTRLIRVSEVQSITGLSRSYIYELTKKGLFPKSVSLVPGGSARAWVEVEVCQWVSERLANRDIGGAK